MKSLFAKQIKLFFLIFKNQVFLLCFVVLVSHIFSYFLPNQNNPTEDWLRLIGMHNEKNMIFDFFSKLSYLFLQMNSSYIYR